MARPCAVRVAIPHCFRAGGDDRYGSRREGNRLRRSLALARCLGSVLALARSAAVLELNHDHVGVVRCPADPQASRDPGAAVAELVLELHVFVTGCDCLEDVLALYAGRIVVHRLDLADPLELALAARDWLVAATPVVDLALYLEDDLVVHDPYYFDKLLWFSAQVQHRYALMPHRYELSGDPSACRLQVDGRLELPSGPLTPGRQGQGQAELLQVRGTYLNGQAVEFVEAANPHAGTFCLSAPQVRWLQAQGPEALPREGFIGPLETAATYTVLCHFPVLKPAASCRDFLTIEHGHPVFLAYVDRRVRSGPT